MVIATNHPVATGVNGTTDWKALHSWSNRSDSSKPVGFIFGLLLKWELMIYAKTIWVFISWYALLFVRYWINTIYSWHFCNRLWNVKHCFRYWLVSLLEINQTTADMSLTGWNHITRFKSRYHITAIFIRNDSFESIVGNSSFVLDKTEINANCFSQSKIKNIQI